MKPYIILLGLFVLMLSSCDPSDQGEELPGGEWDGKPAVDKRGVAYSFTHGNTTEADMNLLTPAVKWFYNWGIASSGVDEKADEHGLAYYPMAWDEEWNEKGMRAYLDTHPECEYILAYNEPNLKDQANITPAQAARDWPRLKKLVQQYNGKGYKLKLVSPAMQYGTLPGYGDPIKWLDEFFKQPGVSSKDVHAIAIHCYMRDAGSMKGYIDKFKKYNKQIWVTEFCAWETIENAEQQMRYMSEIVTLMELDPFVAKYAWFIPKADWAGTYNTEVPFHHLLTVTTPPALTDLGIVFTNMGTCDTGVWIPAGQRIKAAHFSNCNTSASVNRPELSRSVHFRPGTDPEGEVLDIYNFTNNKWVEYQVHTPTTKAHTLSIRNKATSAATMEISVDGNVPQSVSLSQSNNWRTSGFPLDLEAGQHTIRLRVTGGDCALNWLKVE